MNLNDLLAKSGLDTKTRRHILVMRHRPHELALRKVLPWLAAEKPSLYNAYQQTQSERAENALQQAEFLASFIGLEAGRALFIGIFKVGRIVMLSYDAYWRMKSHRELQSLGMAGLPRKRRKCLWFDLELTNIYCQWKGKLIVDWLGGELAWWRWADRNEFPVRAILEESILVRTMPAAEEMILSWEELRNLPKSWKSALAQWRGIYLILDRSDGKSYVGSAYGQENIYTRWSNYAKRGHGGNKLLRGRAPENFVFSILERVSPDMKPEDVVHKESTWKNRLHTREHGLNNN